MKERENIARLFFVCIDDVVSTGKIKRTSHAERGKG